MTFPVQAVLAEVRKRVVGQDVMVERLLIGLLTGGHVLLEGVPGLAKTLTVRTLADVLHSSFSRIQFTPDLLPADVVGTMIYEAQSSAFTVRRGPIFAQIVLADEINRATPKTQSAMLEAMQEHSVTVAGTVHRLKEPFFVMATQNPLEQEGTYPLPEAQLDRFFFKLVVQYSGREEMATIIDRTTRNEWPTVEKVLTGDDIRRYQALIREVIVAPPVQDYAIRLVLATHPGGAFAQPGTNRYIRCGASPRGAQAIVLASKVRALLEGRFNVSFEDVKKVCLPALRHRIMLNFEAQAENVPSDSVLDEILKAVPERVPDAPAARR
ncbi:MAG: AAA family ATPase [Gemmatimonadales bacterium]|nr:AAA family ATPase [Gemmatimonadales bacterium]